MGCVSKKLSSCFDSELLVILPGNVQSDQI